MGEIVHVAVGVILDSEGRVLTTLRPNDIHQGGLWEFPGGKLESGEDVRGALQRELEEEVGIHIDKRSCSPLKTIVYNYPDKSVKLDVWSVRKFTGQANGREGQQIRWQEIENLDPDEFPSANRKIIEILKLPQHIAITTQVDNLQSLQLTMERLRDQRIKLVQFRQPQLQAKDFFHWAVFARDFCRANSMRLQLNTTPEIYATLGTDGLHINSTVLNRLTARPVSSSALFSASCHSLAELQHANDLGVDYALLSPVHKTRSHPESLQLGWKGFKAIANKVSLPVYALGGVGPGDLVKARNAGGHGVAGVSAYSSS